MYLHIYTFNQPVLLCPLLLTFFSGHVLKREIYITIEMKYFGETFWTFKNIYCLVRSKNQ